MSHNDLQARTSVGRVPSPVTYKILRFDAHLTMPNGVVVTFRVHGRGRTAKDCRRDAVNQARCWRKAITTAVVAL